MLNNVVKIVNIKQVKLYIKNGVKPIDIIYDSDNNKYVFVFRTSDTKEVWELWKNYELK